MPSKKKKYNARFPAGRIKKIMQSDEEIGKVAQAVPVIISRTLELFVESLLNKTVKITYSRNAKTLSTSHMKQCIMSEQRFDFLRELVKNIPDISVAEENCNDDEPQSSPEENYPDSDTPYDLSMPSTSSKASRISTNGDQANQRQLVVAASRYSENGNSLSTVGSQITRALLTTQDESSRAHLKRDSDVIQRLRQRIASSASVSATSTAQNPSAMPSSVIMHTTSLLAADLKSNDCLPPKLYRTDSAPATAAGNWQQHQHQKQQHDHPPVAHTKIPITTHHQQQHHHQQQQRQRLKHQSHSLSSSARNHGERVNTSNDNSSSNSSLPYNSTNTMNQQLPPIPAPIVSIDFCNKPVVKIDYSNLTIPATRTSAIAPLSAPANISASAATGFNFNAEPVINIDLSNIVGASSSSSNQPAVATISIGNIAPPVSSASNSLVAGPTYAATKTIGNDLLNTKTAVSASEVTAAVAIDSTQKPNSDSFFELDEDYDNI